MLEIRNKPDDTDEILTLLEAVAQVLDVDTCWFHQGNFHFCLPQDWTVSITPESAGRVRVETWQALRLRDRKWCRSGDCNRLRWLVRIAHELALDPA